MEAQIVLKWILKNRGYGERNECLLCRFRVYSIIQTLSGRLAQLLKVQGGGPVMHSRSVLWIYNRNAYSFLASLHICSELN